MPEIRPFRATLYNSNLKAQIGDLISPPYDVLSDEDVKTLTSRHSRNSVQLCLKFKDETYKEMRERFQSWKAEGVLQTLEQNSFYLVEEEYEWEGKFHKRIGFIGLLKVSPFEERKVFPHEYTLSGPKTDRLELLQAMRAEFSQIFLCYEDPKMELEGIFQSLQKQEPHFQGTDIQGIKRKLWIVSEPASIQKLVQLLEKKELLIADGHHRYETALCLRELEKSKESEFVQAYFTNTAGEGFKILPIHRLTRLPSNLTYDQFMTLLSRKFQTEKLNLPEDLNQFLQKNRDESSIGFLLFLGSKNRVFYVRRKKSNENDAEIFALQEDIFEPIFNWSTTEISKGHLQFEHSTSSFLSKLEKTEDSLGFFLPPTDLSLIRKIVSQGKRMPQKSTFFYPKIASGLVIYELGSYY